MLWLAIDHHMRYRMPVFGFFPKLFNMFELAMKFIKPNVVGFIDLLVQCRVGRVNARLLLTNAKSCKGRARSRARTPTDLARTPARIFRWNEFSCKAPRKDLHFFCKKSRKRSRKGAQIPLAKVLQ